MTADQLHLITAAVDGELSAPETRAFRLLVAASDEVRVLYAKLKSDSDRVRALPQVAPPADLQAKILARLATVTPAPRVKPTPLAEPKPAPTAVPPRRVPAWMQVAIAASVFLCLAAGSFALITNQATPKGAVAKNPWANILPAAQDSATAVPSPVTPNGERPDPDAVVRNNVMPAPAPRAVTRDTVAIAPEPRTVLPPDFHTFPLVPKLSPFERVEVRLPFLRPVADLGREDINQELLDELNRDPLAYKFDLFVRDPARGVEVFQHAAKASGLAVLADAATLDKLKKKQAHAIVIYTESLTPTELAALFAKLSTEDAKFSPKVCDSLHAAPVVRSEELELKAILGVDAGLFKRPVGTGTSGGAGQGTDKGVSAGTIDSVVKSVTKGERVAVMLTWQTTNANILRTNPAMSAELKSYLTKRGERKPNAVPAVIVIRTAG